MQVILKKTGEVFETSEKYWEAVTAALRDPFDPDEVKFRIASTSGDKQRGLLAPYVDSRGIQKRLDDVLGIEGWQCLITRNGTGSLCNIQIWDPFRQMWLSKMDGSGDTEVESFKGSISGAQKRAGQQWGIGTYFYHLPKLWVDVEKVGNSYVPADGEVQRIRKILPDWARPGGRGYPLKEDGAKPPATGSAAGQRAQGTASAAAGKPKPQGAATGAQNGKKDKWENWKAIVDHAKTPKYGRTANEIRLLLGINYPWYDAEWVALQDWGVKCIHEALNAQTRLNLVDEFERVARDVLDGDGFAKLSIELEQLDVKPFGGKSTLLDDIDKLKAAIAIWAKYNPKKSGKRAA